MNYILISVGVVGVLGALYGIVLAFASKKFELKVDKKIVLMDDVLPGVNCGACGYPGCNAYAKAIYEEGEKIDKCAPGGNSVIEMLANIMGVQASKKEKKVALIKCSSGGENKTNYKFDYHGIANCSAILGLGHGNNVCKYGCVGGNSCSDVCTFGAIKIDEKNNKFVDRELCTGCGACVTECPLDLIQLVSISKKVHVICSSFDKGVVSRKSCGSVSCIGCRICERKCPVGAIIIKNNLAVIDFEKCTSCGICAKVCPTKVIEDLNS